MGNSARSRFVPFVLHLSLLWTVRTLPSGLRRERPYAVFVAWLTAKQHPRNAWKTVESLTQ
jgi:hypothetical protein